MEKEGAELLGTKLGEPASGGKQRRELKPEGQIVIASWPLLRRPSWATSTQAAVLPSTPWAKLVFHCRRVWAQSNRGGIRQRNLILLQIAKCSGLHGCSRPNWLSEQQTWSKQHCAIPIRLQTTVLLQSFFALVLSTVLMGGTIKSQFRIEGREEEVGFRCSAKQEEKPSYCSRKLGSYPERQNGLLFLRQFACNECFVFHQSS